MDNRFKNKKLSFTLNTRHTPPLTDKEKKVIVALVDHINPNNKNTNVHSIASSILLDRVDKIDHSKLKKLLISLIKKTVEYCRRFLPGLQFFVPLFAFKCTSPCGTVYHCIEKGMNTSGYSCLC